MMVIINLFNEDSRPYKSGTPNARINYWAYQVETPHFDFSN